MITQVIMNEERKLMSTLFCDDVVHHLPRLEGFARKLAGNRSLADDLVQETVLRALTHADQFRPGTNLLAWLMTILRNTYFNEKRRERRLTVFDANAATSLIQPANEPEAHLHFGDVAKRFEGLPAAQREALVLVGANGFSYEVAAQIAGCAVGTMKSRVSRGRAQLQQLLKDHEHPVPELDQDELIDQTEPLAIAA
jgi:RNA polymerase sigma-70 factor, ECF subfamily